jgi:Na+/H+ antiporter NhaB
MTSIFLSVAYPLIFIFYGRFLIAGWYFIKDLVFAILNEIVISPRARIEWSLRRITGRQRPDYARISELEQM